MAKKYKWIDFANPLTAKITAKDILSGKVIIDGANYRWRKGDKK